MIDATTVRLRCINTWTDIVARGYYSTTTSACSTAPTSDQT